MRYLIYNLFRKGICNYPKSNKCFKNLGNRWYASECGEPTEKKGLILGIYEADNNEICLTPSAKKFDEHLCGKLTELIRASRNEIGKWGAKVYNNIEKDFWSIAVVSLGKDGQGYDELEAIDQSLENVRSAAGIGARKLSKQGVTRILVESFGKPEQAAEGAALSLWRYQENKNRENWKTIPSLELFDCPDAESWQRGLFKAESQNLARRLCDTPANQMTPLHFAQEAVNELCPCGIKVEVHDKDWIETKKMFAFLAVARGSCEPPIFLDIHYCGGPPDQKPILLAGKGVTYDSGGLCPKLPDIMSTYRADMSGAACVVATIRAANALSLPLNLNGVIPLCENMPSGMAMKCGDIVKGFNGKSIQISNTDNEGRLLLADALAYGQKTHKPRLIIDIASMTPGIKDALGSAASGVFCNSQTMWCQLRNASIVTGDRVWRLPLWKYFTKQVTSNASHDVNNKGFGQGEPCLAAAFLNEFVYCVDWVHFDITGVGMKSEDKLYTYLTKGRMTGRPTRTLIQFLYQLACPNPET
ncbi:hypothetical protein RN001_006424 [Aquatica leii]|uniref:Cytosol aminopeptidase n=1 Tax=Aquatica leii TaxID=1421715 RepID=A0AAN7P802_9COLE|nr:hypothetical protein RN001_006424 [Aquatica leii]